MLGKKVSSYAMYIPFLLNETEEEREREIRKCNFLQQTMTMATTTTRLLRLKPRDDIYINI